MSSGVSAEFNLLCVKTFDEIRAVFDSKTASPHGPLLFAGRGPYLCYEYDLQNFQEFMHKFARPPFTGNAGYSVLKRVLLETHVFESNTFPRTFPPPPFRRESQSNLVSEILGRTLREQRLNGILGYFLEFLSLHHPQLLLDVLNYRGFIRHFPGHRDHPQAHPISAGVFAHLVYAMVYDQGSAALLHRVARLDADLNHRQSIDNCEVYGKFLFEKHDDISKIRYLAGVFGSQVLLSGGGILRQYVTRLKGMLRPFTNPHAVDTIVALADLCPSALHQATADPVMHMIVRDGAYPSTSTPQAKINAMLEKLCAHLQLHHLTQTRDLRGRTLQEYAEEHRLLPVLRRIRVEKMRCCMLSQLLPNHTNSPCPMHSLHENTLQMIYRHL